MTEREWETSTDPRAMLEQVRGKVSDRKLRLFACACCRQVWDRLTSEQTRRAVEVGERFVDGLASDKERGMAYNAADNAPAGYERSLAYMCVRTDVSLIHSDVLLGMDPVPRTTQVEIIRDIVGNPFCEVKLPPPACDACNGSGWVYAYGTTRQVKCDYCRGDKCPWLTPTVLGLAQAGYDERRSKKCPACDGYGYHREDWFPGDEGRKTCGNCNGTGCYDDGTLDPERLAVLSDALEEAGCDNDEILHALRGDVRCGDCGGTGSVNDDSGGNIGVVRHCGCRDGWRPREVPFYRGFWVLDLLTGRE